MYGRHSYLNGGWDRSLRNEDADAPGRLFYVAMTRARRSLAISTSGQHPFVPPDADWVLRRSAPVVSGSTSLPTSLYQMPDLKTVDLSWAGRLGSSHASLNAIASARVGDALQLRREGDVWIIEDAQGRSLGRMARSWSPPEGRNFVRGGIGAIAPTEGISRDGCNSGARSLSLQARTARGAMASQIFSRM